MAGEPDDFHPDLSPERLVSVAQLLRQGRNDALDRFDPTVGSNNWTLGCEAFAFGCYRICEAVEQERFPWLDVVDPTAQFVFKIGDVPIRFYKGPADEPNARTLRQSFSELRQLDFGFEEGDPGRSLTYRIAIETDFDGAVTTMSFVVLSGDHPVSSWEIPFDDRIEPVVPVQLPRDEGVELPKPQVGAPIIKPAAVANDD